MCGHLTHKRSKKSYNIRKVEAFQRSITQQFPWHERAATDTATECLADGRGAPHTTWLQRHASALSKARAGDRSDYRLLRGAYPLATIIRRWATFADFKIFQRQTIHKFVKSI